VKSVAERREKRRFGFLSLSLAGLFAASSIASLGGVAVAQSPSASPEAPAPSEAASVAPTPVPTLAVVPQPTDLSSFCKISVAFGLPLGNSSNPFAWIGSELGFFAQNQVNPEVISLNGDSARGVALLDAGQLDVGIYGLERVLRADAAGTPVPERAVFNVQSKSQYEGIVNADSPIQTLADLKGKNIGVPELGETNQHYVDTVIASVGLQPTDVNYVATGIGVPMGEALRNGSVDAAFSTRGQMAPIVTGDYDVRFLPRPDFAEQFVTGNVVARSDLTPEKEQCLKSYLRAYAESIVFSKANPTAAMLVNWHMFPDAIPTNVPFDEALKTAVDNYTAYLSYIDPLDGKWGYMPPDKMDFYNKYLGLDGVVDITKYYTNDYIDYVNDFDTAAIEQMAQNYQAPTPAP